MEKQGTTSVSSEVGSSVNGSAEKPHETVRTLRFSCLFSFDILLSLISILDKLMQYYETSTHYRL